MLKIGQVSSLWHSTPPRLYGGTERIVSYLTEHLIENGHKVTLFACGSSVTRAELISVYPRPLIEDNIPWTNVMYPLLHITEAFDRINEFDILHIHLNKASDYFALPLARKYQSKVILTPHFPYPLSQNRVDRHEVLQKYKDLNFTSISHSQRKGGENLNWLGTIYNGIKAESYTFHPQAEDYFCWLGKFNPDKGTHEAIMAAKKAGVKLKLAGSIDSLEAEDLEYFNTKVKPYIDDQQIIYVGELRDQQKNDFLGKAIAMLFPVQWNEPFGLTMAEAMACGTPVIAFPNGAAPEVIQDKETGFLVRDVDEMVEKMTQVHTLNRQTCQLRVKQLFTSEKMAQNYESLYHKLIKHLA